MRFDRPLVVLNKLTPALIALVVNTAIGFAKAFGWLNLEPDQQTAVDNVVNVVCVILVGYGIISATNNVTPVSDPQLPTGTMVKVTDSENNVTGSATVS